MGWIKQHNVKNINRYRNECYAKMEANIRHMNAIWTRDLGINANFKKGSGASGGAAAALMIYLDAQMQSGFDIVAKFVNLDEKIKGADLIITGEGSFDSQTSNGKVPQGLAKRAYLQNVSAIVCIAGKVES